MSFLGLLKSNIEMVTLQMFQNLQCFLLFFVKNYKILKFSFYELAKLLTHAYISDIINSSFEFIHRMIFLLSLISLG